MKIVQQSGLHEMQDGLKNHTNEVKSSVSAFPLSFEEAFAPTRTIG